MPAGLTIVLSFSGEDAAQTLRVAQAMGLSIEDYGSRAILNANRDFNKALNLNGEIDNFIKLLESLKLPDDK